MKEDGMVRVHLRFDDANISRTAFEICISRLYSPYPFLNLHPSLLPTPSDPLTATFPNPPILTFPTSRGKPPPTQQDSTLSSQLNPSAQVPHLLTPRTLLSLLSTSIYLGLDSIIRECLTLILGSIGPWTVVRYLKFAIGEGVGEEEEGLEGVRGIEGVRGLEGLGREIPIEDRERERERESAKDEESLEEIVEVKTEEVDDEQDQDQDQDQETEGIGVSKKCSGKQPAVAEPASIPSIRGQTQSHTRRTSNLTQSSLRTQSESYPEGETTLSDIDHDHDHDSTTSGPAPKFFYGPISDKIGEASMAWLARWCNELLEVEEKLIAREERRKSDQSDWEARMREEEARRRFNLEQTDIYAGFEGLSFGGGGGEGSGSGSRPREGILARTGSSTALLNEAGGSGSGSGSGGGTGKLSSSLPEDNKRRPRSISWQNDMAERTRRMTGSIDRRVGLFKVPSNVPAVPAASGSGGGSISSGAVTFALPTLPTERRALKSSLKMDQGTKFMLPPLRVWGNDGLPADIVRALISSDAFFVPNELERYNFAKRVILLRIAGRKAVKAAEAESAGNVGRGRAGGESAVKEEDEDVDMDDEESSLTSEWEAEENDYLSEIFRSGIYFSHIDFDELQSMSSDLNPTTGLPYVPQSVLTSAFWAHREVQKRITAYRPDGTFPTALGSSKFDLDTLKPAGTPPTPQKPHRSKSAGPIGVDVGLVYTMADIVAEAENAARMWAAKSRTVRRGTSSPNVLSGRQSPAYDTPSRGGHLAVAGLGNIGNLVGETHYWPVPTDGTLRIGDGVSSSGNLPPLSPLPDFGPGSNEFNRKPHSSSASDDMVETRLSCLDDKYFGFGSSMRTSSEIHAKYKDDQLMKMGTEEEEEAALWSRFEPFRFAVEFWGVNELNEKTRAYSQTQFHAGSYFNIYVQAVRSRKDRNSIQLGIYLHRQSMLEPLPAPSRPRSNSADRPDSPVNWNASSPAISTLPPGHTMIRPENPLNRSISVTPIGSTTALARSMSPPAGGIGSDDENADGTGGETARAKPAAPVATYRDPRKTAKVWFSVSCASAMGTALTRFSSGPDMFTVSQSWGWKSSSLRSQEYLSATLGEGAPTLSERLDGGVLGWISEPIDETEFKKKDLRSLRATVCMGVM